MPNLGFQDPSNVRPFECKDRYRYHEEADMEDLRYKDPAADIRHLAQQAPRLSGRYERLPLSRFAQNRRAVLLRAESFDERAPAYRRA